jgi:diacylglycerol kinase (ATP)
MLAKKNILVVRNPKAGQGSRLFENTMRVLQETAERLEVIETQNAGHAEEIARNAADANEWDVLAVAGGDGTLNEAANGLIGSELPLGIIPVGTANVLAREIHLPMQAQGIARTLQCGADISIHPGLLNGRVFLMMAGAGFDGRVVARVSEKLKRYMGPGAYIISALTEIFSGPSPLIQAEINGSIHSASWIVVSNICCYGGPYYMAPSAHIETSGFVVTLFTSQTPWGRIRDMLGVAINRSGVPWGAMMLSAKKVYLSGDDGVMQMDGDFGGPLPATVEVCPQPLRLMIPRVLVTERVRFKSPVECTGLTSSIQG